MIANEFMDKLSNKLNAFSSNLLLEEKYEWPGTS